jgi:hypothetical protein
MKEKKFQPQAEKMPKYFTSLSFTHQKMKTRILKDIRDFIRIKNSSPKFLRSLKSEIGFLEEKKNEEI